MFYIVLPFIINFIHPKKLKIKLIILSGIYLASICYSYFWEHIIIIPFLAKQLPGHMCFFAAGIIAYYTKEYCIKNSQLLLLPAIGIYLLEHYLFHFELITPACLAIMIMFAAYHFKPLNQVGKHGDFSYGIYLIHFPIIQIFVASGYFTNQPITAIVICLICIVLLSVCSWLAIEKPSLNFFKN
jgi:peptidoglycan/LPS O-acetylase OafA/YrhL